MWRRIEETGSYARNLFIALTIVGCLSVVAMPAYAARHHHQNDFFQQQVSQAQPAAQNQGNGNTGSGTAGSFSSFIQQFMQQLEQLIQQLEQQIQQILQQIGQQQNPGGTSSSGSSSGVTASSSSGTTSSSSGVSTSSSSSGSTSSSGSSSGIVSTSSSGGTSSSGTTTSSSGGTVASGSSSGSSTGSSTGSSSGTVSGSSSGSTSSSGSSGGIVTSDGVCGPANQTTVSSAPTTGLCSAGTPTAVTVDGNSYIWQCIGTNGGDADGCLATKSSGSTSSGSSSGGNCTTTGGNAGTVLTDGLDLTQDQVNAIAAAINATQVAEVPNGECFSGTCYPQDFLAGDTIITTAPNLQSSGPMGSLTDKDGNTWTLVAGTYVTEYNTPPDWWWGGIELNGQLLDGYVGYFIAIRLLNDGTVWVEEAKQGGWWSLTAANETPGAFASFTRPGEGPDPGPGPNNVGGSGSGGSTCSSSGSGTTTSGSSSGSGSGSSSGTTSTSGSSNGSSSGVVVGGGSSGSSSDGGGTTAGGSSGSTSSSGSSSGGITTTSGTCGSANNQTFSTAPTTGLCSAGTATAVTTDGSDFIWQCVGTNGGDAAGCIATQGSNSCLAPGTGTPTGQFQTAFGQIYDPNGNLFKAYGVNVYDQDMPAAFPVIPGTLPGINFIRLTAFDLNQDSASYLAPYIQQMTSRGIIVEIEDHNYPDVITGSDLANAEQWYASLASAFNGNPYVWFGTQNEPSNGDPVDVDNEISGIYNAIRGTGNNTILMMDPQGGFNTSGQDPSVFANMTNVVWDFHYYNWISNNSSDLGANEAALAGEIAPGQAFTSANGQIPIIIGEYGEASSVNDASTQPDPGGMEVLQAVQNAVTTGQVSGASYWEWTQSGFAVDAVVINAGGGPLNAPYGTEVAQFIASGQGAGAGCTVAGPASGGL